MASRNSASTIPPTTSTRPRSACHTSRGAIAPTASAATSDTAPTQATPVPRSGSKLAGISDKCLPALKRVPLSFDNILNRSLIIYRRINEVSYSETVTFQGLLVSSLSLLVDHHSPQFLLHYPALLPTVNAGQHKSLLRPNRG